MELLLEARRMLTTSDESPKPRSCPLSTARRSNATCLDADDKPGPEIPEVEAVEAEPDVELWRTKVCEATMERPISTMTSDL